MLVEWSRRAGIDETDRGFPFGKLRSVKDKVVCLLLAKLALEARIPT